MDNATSTSALNVSVDFMNGIHDNCNTEKIPVEFIGVYLAFVVIPIFSNGILLTSIGLNWDKLRHNIVYIYAISCLLSVICFCLIVTYDLIHTMCHFDSGVVDGGVLQRYNRDDFSHVQVMRGWSFRRGLTVAMLLVMELNVGSIVYAVGDNAYFVSRNIADPKTSKKDRPSARSFGSETTHRYKKLGKRGKATLQLSVSWMAPILICLPTAVDWNCLNYCTCLRAFRSIERECTPPESSSVVCSRLYYPTTRSFVIFCTAFYAITVVFMFAMLASVVRRFIKVHSPTSPARATTAETQSGRIHANNAPKMDQEKDKTHDQDGNGGIAGCDDQASGIRDTSTIGTIENATMTRSSKRPKLHDNVKLLIALTISVTVSVTPMILTWFVDVVRPTSPPPEEVLFDVAIAVTLFHALCVPWILLRYMAGLRKACKDAFVKCPCFTTIAIKRRKTNAAATRVSAAIGASSNAQIGDFN